MYSWSLTKGHTVNIHWTLAPTIPELSIEANSLISRPQQSSGSQWPLRPIQRAQSIPGRLGGKDIESGAFHLTT